MLASLNLISSRGIDRAAEASALVDASPAAARTTQRGANPGAVPATGADEALGRATLAAIGGLFVDRQVAVSSFHDDATGRMVYRVADPHSGEVLLQAPSEALLRLYANSREPQGPLLAIEA